MLMKKGATPNRVPSRLVVSAIRPSPEGSSTNAAASSAPRAAAGSWPPTKSVHARRSSAASLSAMPRPKPRPSNRVRKAPWAYASHGDRASPVVAVTQNSAQAMMSRTVRELRAAPLAMREQWKKHLWSARAHVSPSPPPHGVVQQCGERSA